MRDCITAEDEYIIDLKDSINLHGVYCLNERHEGSVKKIFKSKENMTNRDENLESNKGDPELLIYIPFNSAVKMKSMTLIGGEYGTSPAIIKVYVNVEHPDFDLIEGATATQVYKIHEIFKGIRMRRKYRRGIIISIKTK